jgi:hypothetical protein
MSNLDRTLDAVDKGVNRLQIGCWTISSISVDHEIAGKSPKLGVRADARTPNFGYPYNICDLLNLFFAGFCLWGVYAAYTGWQLQTRGERTTGTVIRMEESSTSEGGCCVYSPVIEFDVNGQAYSFEGGNASYPPEYEVRSGGCAL